MSDLVDYISQYVTDPDISQILLSTIILLFVVFGIQLFGWCFGRR